MPGNIIIQKVYWKKKQQQLIAYMMNLEVQYRVIHIQLQKEFRYRPFYYLRGTRQFHLPKEARCALAYGSRDLGSSPGRGDIMLCSQARRFTLTAPLYTQGYKWVLVNLMLRVALGWTRIPSRWEQKYSQSLHATETGDIRRSDGPLGS